MTRARRLPGFWSAAKFHAGATIDRGEASVQRLLPGAAGACLCVARRPGSLSEALELPPPRATDGLGLAGARAFSSPKVEKSWRT